LTPLWKKVFDEKVWPFLEGVLAKYRTGRFKNMPFDYGSRAVGKNGEQVNLLFIPDRKNSAETFTRELVKDGLEKAMVTIAEDERGAAVVRRDDRSIEEQIALCFPKTRVAA
jgi:hypothetical protein